MYEHEIWVLVKELCKKHNLNRYDSFVFILREIKKTEDLIQRRLLNMETQKIVDRAIIYLISKKFT